MRILKILVCSLKYHNWKLVDREGKKYHCDRCNSTGTCRQYWIDGMFKMPLIDRDDWSWYSLDFRQCPPMENFFDLEFEDQESK